MHTHIPGISLLVLLYTKVQHHLWYEYRRMAWKMHTSHDGMDSKIRGVAIPGTQVRILVFLASSASGRPAVAIRRPTRCLPVAGVVAVQGSTAKLWTAVVVTETVTASTDSTAAGSLIVELCFVSSCSDQSDYLGSQVHGSTPRLFSRSSTPNPFL